MTYTINEFRDFFEQIAVYDTVIPKDADHVVLEIPMPVDDLVCRVDTGVNIYTSEYDGGDAAVMLYNTTQNEVAHQRSFEVDGESWASVFEKNVREEMKNWREFVL